MAELSTELENVKINNTTQSESKEPMTSQDVNQDNIGSASLCPKDRDQCIIQLKQIAGSTWNHEFEKSSKTLDGFTKIQITLGNSCDPVLCSLEKHLMSMKVSGKRTVCFSTLQNSHQTDASEDQQYQFELELISVQKCQEIWRLSASEKYSLAEKYKSLGVALFKDKYVDLSFEKFSAALKLLICMLPENEFPSDLKTDYKKLKCQCYSNLAMCQLLHQSYDFVISNCSKALGLQPDNVKCLYRRALAYKSLNDYDKALVDLNSAHKIEPANRAVIEEINIVKRLVKEEDNKNSHVYNKMFS